MGACYKVSDPILTLLTPYSTLYLSVCLFHCFWLFISLSQRCAPISLWATHWAFSNTHTLTECIRVAVIYNTALLSHLNNSYKQTIDMEMERCSSLAGSACFVNG